jgi:hypothetical protein
MSTRERWIVYPLLFMTLGITMRLALRDQLSTPARLQVAEITAGQIHCNQLQAVQGIAAGQIGCQKLQSDQVNCNRLQSISGIVHCNEIAIMGPNGRPTVLAGTDSKTKGGLITTLSSAGAHAVALQSSDSGGVVVADYISGTVVPRDALTTLLSPAPKESPKESPKELEAKPSEAKP